MKFQRIISSSQATLPVVCTIALVLWFVLPSHHNPLDFIDDDYGLWQYLPTFFHASHYSLLQGVIAAAIAVYMMVELKNQNLLLRVNSYMLSSTLALLLALCAPLHPMQPGSLIMVLMLYSYFPLFASYQTPHPYITFSIYLPLSIASLFFPKLLLLVPTYWCLQVYLRSFTFRCFVASLIAIVLPYWLYGGIAVVMGILPQFVTHLQSIISVPDILAASCFLTDAIPHFPTDVQTGNGVTMPDTGNSFLHCSPSAFFSSSLPLLVLTTLMLLIGGIDFQMNKLLDKTRTRSLYNAITWHAILLLLFIIMYHRHTATLLPLLMLDAAMLYGHFFTLTHTRLSHICNIVIFILMLSLVAMPFIAPLL